MPDTTHWIAVRSTFDPYEVPEADLRDEIETHGECVHLVPTRVWRDYQETARRKTLLIAELRTYRRATLVVAAAKDGYPMPPMPPSPSAPAGPK